MSVPRPLPASWVLIPCPTCDGDGFIEVSVHGGYFDARMECWYPFEKMIPCPRCKGSCEVEVTYDLDLPEAAIRPPPFLTN